MIQLPRRPIRTERLVLEPTSTASAPALVMEIARSREHLARWLSWAAGNRLEDTLADAAAAEQAWLEDRAYHFTVISDAQPVGRVSLRRSSVHPGEGNLGYWISAGHAGRGLISEAAAAMVEFAFHSAGMTRVELRADVENRASQRVAEKIGMRREGRARGALPSIGEGARDAYLYGMTVADPRRDTAMGSELRPPGVPALSEPDFSRGLVTAVVQDELDGTVLMVAHMDQEAYRRTRASGHAWFWSRSREKLWEKGETSGNFLVVSSVAIDCDGDAVLLRVSAAGPACHTGARTCFHNPV